MKGVHALLLSSCRLGSGTYLDTKPFCQGIVPAALCVRDELTLEIGQVCQKREASFDRPDHGLWLEPLAGTHQPLQILPVVATATNPHEERFGIEGVPHLPEFEDDEAS